MIDSSKYTELLKKYLDGNISAAEHNELFSMSASNDVHDLLSEQMDTDLKGEAIEGTDLPPHVAEEILRNILSLEKNTTRIVTLFPGRKKIVGWLVAAVIMGFIVIAGIYYGGKGVNQANS